MSTYELLKHRHQVLESTIRTAQSLGDPRDLLKAGQVTNVRICFSKVVGRNVQAVHLDLPEDMYVVGLEYFVTALEELAAERDRLGEKIKAVQELLKDVLL